MQTSLPDRRQWQQLQGLLDRRVQQIHIKQPPRLRHGELASANDSAALDVGASAARRNELYAHAFAALEEINSERTARTFAHRSRLFRAHMDERITSQAMATTAPIFLELDAAASSPSSELVAAETVVAPTAEAPCVETDASRACFRRFPSTTASTVLALIDDAVRGAILDCCVAVGNDLPGETVVEATQMQ